MHGSRYAAALTVFARCHYDRRRHKRVRGRSTGRGQPSVTNVLPPKGVGGAARRGAARRDDDDDEEEQAEQGADRGTPSLSYHRRPIGPRRHTARLFFLPLSRARQINTGECRRRTIDQKPIVRVRFVAPRPIASRIGLTDEGGGREVHEEVDGSVYDRFSVFSRLHFKGNYREGVRIKLLSLYRRSLMFSGKLWKLIDSSKYKMRV